MSNKIGIYVGGKKVAETSINTEPLTHRETEKVSLVESMQYYLRRGNRYYFKNVKTGAKISLTTNENTAGILKYREVYKMRTDINFI